ncbi:MAG TPA: hypothetical protein VGL56_05600 [Fimbriimonadaceae bacterium]
MKSRIFPILLLAALIVGCKPKDDTSTTTTSTTAPGVATTSGDAASADAKPAADSSGNSLIGVWTVKDDPFKGTMIEFKDGGTVTMNIPGATAKDPGLEMDGNYKVDGTTLTMSGGTMKATAPEGADEALKKKVDDENKVPQSAKPEDETGTIAWIDKDSFMLTDSKKAVTTYIRKS